MWQASFGSRFGTVRGRSEPKSNHPPNGRTENRTMVRFWLTPGPWTEPQENRTKSPVRTMVQDRTTAALLERAETDKGDGSQKLRKTKIESGNVPPKTTSQYTSSPSFEGLILHYLDQLENLLPVLVLVQILPFSEFLVDSTSPTAKLATMICGLEQLTRAIREFLSTRKSYPHQLLGVIRCLWATGSANLGSLFTTEEIWARAYYSELIIPGLNTNSIPEKLIRHTLERVLLYLADAERMCFTNQTQLIGVGNICFCIRQLRQTISHHLLFQTFHPISTSIQKGGLVPEFVDHEPGFTNIVLLQDAVRVHTLDQDNLQPGGPKTWSIFLGAVFIILGFISSHHTCFIFSLLSAPPNTTDGLMRQTSGWSSAQLVASAGVIGCFCDRVRAGAVTIGTIPYAFGILLVLISPQFASSPLVRYIDAISTDHLMFLSVVPLLLFSSHEQSFWAAIENTAVLYVVIRLLAFAVDKSSMKRKRRDLVRISRKYNRRNEEQGEVYKLQRYFLSSSRARVPLKPTGSALWSDYLFLTCIYAKASSKNITIQELAAI
ncbi:uncharacterized protein HD556DRAFT_1314828 [Suillus plorans]|uniref:Uncharacterized protein n=1 Tax=Suillus plorans TaxID=116603 RepID=A0A9P7DA81_9AGAM|nr:uncharacterized protein HD556DRAFT_1314828 [Suillus plorans]KAG1784758.1 hypothetical protein HD556DRAFT_1314828 [Suillus plorans]